MTDALSVLPFVDTMKRTHPTANIQVFVTRTEMVLNYIGIGPKSSGHELRTEV